MSLLNSRHLSEDAVIRGVVDSRDLSAAELEHLRDCPVCRSRLDELSCSLEGLGRAAQAAVPPAPPLPTIGGSSPQRVEAGRPWMVWCSFKPVAAAAALLVVVLWIGVFRDRTPPGKTLWKMTENSELFGLDEREAEDLLPEKLVQLTEVEPLVASDEFLEFIVPSFEEADLQPETEEGVS